MYSKAEIAHLIEPYDHTTNVFRSRQVVCDSAGNIVGEVESTDDMGSGCSVDFDPATGLMNTTMTFPPDLGASVADEERIIKGCDNIIEFYDTKYLEMVNDSSLDEDTKKHYLRRADYEKWLAICRYVRANAPLGW